MSLIMLNAKPLSIGAAAVYPWKKGWMDVGLRQAKYPDENGNRDFNLFRKSGMGDAAPAKSRIWVPRRMVQSGPDTQDLRDPGVDSDFNVNFKARNTEQTRVVVEAVKLLKAGESFVTEAPTGFGKTYCGSAIIGEVGKKAIVVVNKEDIRDQWLEAFQAVLGLSVKPGEVGLIQGDICDTVGRKIILAMVQSIANFGRYPDWNFRGIGFALWDEVHRVGADYFSNSCFILPAALRMGVSATPKRKDGREEVIEAHIGEVRVRSTKAPTGFRVIQQKSPWKCPTKGKLDSEGRLVVDPDTKEVVKVPIPHSAGKAGHIIRMLTHHHGRNKILTNFTATCFKAGRKIMVQSDTKDHLEILASLISSSGVPIPEITFYVGGLSAKQRAHAKTGRVIMATYAQTAEATDIPDVDTLVMATPKSDVNQIVGRARREHPDKKEVVIFDIVDDTSPLFAGYARNRAKWYKTQGASIKEQQIAAPHIDKQGKSVTIASSIKK